MEYISSEKGLGLYHLSVEEREKMQTLYGILSHYENVRYPNSGKIPLFETLMRDFFPALTLRKEGVGNGEGYNAINRCDHTVLYVQEKFNSDHPSIIELRLYTPLENDSCKMQLEGVNYSPHVVDDLVTVIKGQDYSFGQQRGTRIKGFASYKSIPVVHALSEVLESYAQARRLFREAESLIDEEDFSKRDLETLAYDAFSLPNRVLRKQSREEYDRLLNILADSVRVVS